MATKEEKLDIPIEDAIQEFETKQTEFGDSSAYYNAEERDLAIGIATPPQLRDLLALDGLPRTYVNAIAERLIVEGFRIGDASEADEELWSWFKANSLDTSVMAMVIDMLVYGRSYITISAPGDEDKDNPMLVPDIPIIRVESPLTMFAHKDPRTRDIDWAIRVVKDENDDTVAATMYYKDRTILYVANDGELAEDQTIAHGLGVVPVVDAIHQRGTMDLYGSSIITAEIRNITDALSRMLMNMQVTSELMATPQRIIFGSTVEELNGDEKTGLELYTSSYIAVEDPQGKAIQLPAAELRNFTEAIQALQKKALGYTGLPPQYLSVESDNPASAEAIRSSEGRLVRTCEYVCGEAGDALERTMRIALLVQGQQMTLDHFRMEAVWRDPSTPTYASKADAASKLYANGQGPIPVEQVRIDMGYTPEQRRQMEEWDKNSPLAQMGAMYGSEREDPPAEVSDEPDGDGEVPSS